MIGERLLQGFLAVTWKSVAKTGAELQDQQFIKDILLNCHTSDHSITYNHASMKDGDMSANTHHWLTEL